MMHTFMELKKAAKIKVEAQEIRVAVLGNCATQLFSAALEGCARLKGLNVHVYDADYDQIDAQLLDCMSEVYCYQPNEILIWLATDKLYEQFLQLTGARKLEFAEHVIHKLQSYWRLVSQNCGARIIQMNFTEIPDQVLGQFSCKAQDTFTYQIRKLNFLLQEEMAKNENVYPVDLLSIQVRLGLENFYDAPLYYSSGMTVALNSLPYVAQAVTGVIGAMQGRVKKCVITDLDHTLWGGTVGDDGIEGIEIGELGRGRAFSQLQRWLRQLKEHGILLAVCSKNEERVAKEPFEKHEEMVLRLSDFAVFVANWKDKASNIRLIQEALGISMDAIVFLDDSPFERNLVRQAFPALEVPELPEDPALYLTYLQQCGYFETASYTGGKEDRTSLYQTEFKRRQLKDDYRSLDDYLKSLDMEGSEEPFQPARYARIAQLTQRSNQFNLRTVRYTQEEIARIAQSSKYVTLSYTLKDKFGEYGLVGIVILECRSEKEAFVDTWLMSCRVLKRGMEEFIVNSMVRMAKKQGFQTILAEYLPTAKNELVKDIYSKMGFTETKKYQYRLDIADYREKKSYIRERKPYGKDRNIS